jgi:hypothetical protein
MNDLIRQVAHFLAPAGGGAGPVVAPGVAQHLMERAESEAGRNPLEAAELRDAARAFLSVVR